MKSITRTITSFDSVTLTMNNGLKVINEVFGVGAAPNLEVLSNEENACNASHLQ